MFVQFMGRKNLWSFVYYFTKTTRYLLVDQKS